VARPEAEVGYYGLAYRVLELVLSFGAFYLAAVFPVMSAALADPERLRRVTQKSFQFLFAAGLTVTVCGHLVAGELVRLLAGGGDFAPAGRALAVLVAAALLSWVNGCGGMLLVAADHQRDALWLNVVSLVANVTANLLLVPRYGYLAAAWVTVGSECLQFAGMAYLVRRFTGVAFRVEAASRVLAVAAGAGLLTLLLRDRLSVVLVVPLVAAAWGAAMVATGVVPSPRALLRPAA
jgi:O-antigen/teichoic acid export membrane protein